MATNTVITHRCPICFAVEWPTKRYFQHKCCGAVLCHGCADRWGRRCSAQGNPFTCPECRAAVSLDMVMEGKKYRAPRPRRKPPPPQEPKVERSPEGATKPTQQYHQSDDPLWDGKTDLLVAVCSFDGSPYGQGYLDMKGGDIIWFRRHCEAGEGWSFGLNERTQMDGLFPASFVCPSPSVQQQQCHQSDDRMGKAFWI